MGTKRHKAKAPKRLKVGIISVSSTRSLAEDKSGHWISRRAKKEKHDVLFHQIVPDDAETIRQTVVDVVNNYDPQAILLTGGTGIGAKDVTIEAVRPLLEKELTAFGPLFAQLSFEDIDAAALLSRATAGIMGKTILLCMPGSLKACKLACKVLIFPELGHIVGHIADG